MRLFAVLEDVGSEYETIAPTKISLTPFEKGCWYMDIEEYFEYETIKHEDLDETSWVPYNTITMTHGFYDPKLDYFDEDECNPIFLDKEENFRDEVIETTRYQKYKEGLPIGEPYFD